MAFTAADRPVSKLYKPKRLEKDLQPRRGATKAAGARWLAGLLSR